MGRVAWKARGDAKVARRMALEKSLNQESLEYVHESVAGEEFVSTIPFLNIIIFSVFNFHF
jgi:hypothetical protein